MTEKGRLCWLLVVAGADRGNVSDLFVPGAGHQCPIDNVSAPSISRGVGAGEGIVRCITAKWDSSSR